MAKRLKYIGKFKKEVHNYLRSGYSFTQCGKDITKNPEKWISAESEEVTCKSCLRRMQPQDSEVKGDSLFKIIHVMISLLFIVSAIFVFVNIAEWLEAGSALAAVIMFVLFIYLFFSIIGGKIF